MKPPITGLTQLAGVVGAPVRHSLSPRLHNAWLDEAGIDGAYLAFGPPVDGFERFVDGMRGGTIAGLNVTIPFKERALALADRADALAKTSGAANLLLLGDDGSIEARNTDGEGLLGAFRAQAQGLDLKSGPTLIFGAGGAARGAAASLLEAGSPEVRIVNRSLDRAQALAEQLGGKVRAFDDLQAATAAADSVAVVNATSLGLGGGEGPPLSWSALPKSVVVMDMVYKPLRTEFLLAAANHGHRTVDGLEMLIRQAIPSYAAFFGATPPEEVDARTLLLTELGLAG